MNQKKYVNISTVRKSQGIYIVFTVMLLFVMLGLAALVLGIGFVSTNTSKLQNIANLVSLAALDGYFRTDEEEAYQVKTQNALTRAQAILSQNNLIGTSESFGSLGLQTSGPGGSLELGTWHPQDPDGAMGAENPCPTGYPCFVALTNGAQAPTVNAARVRLNSPRFDMPFAEVFGFNESPSISSSAISVITQTCAAFLLDLSNSLTTETHNSSILQVVPGNASVGEPAVKIVEPQNPALFAFKQSMTQGNCADRNDYDGRAGGTQESFGFTTWCNMSQTRDPSDTNLSRHYRSDYQLENSPEGPIVIDKYASPEPYSSFALGINAGLRKIAGFRSPGDKAFIFGFTGRILDRVPEQGREQSTDIGYLIQLTNLLNRGMLDQYGNAIATQPEIHPNFVDRGWFPLPDADITRSSTNIEGAIRAAQSDLLNYCPSTARKAIFLFSDGLATCMTDSSGTHCSSDYSTQFYAMDNLLRRVLPDLQAGEISFTAVVDGRQIDPHFYNRKVDGKYIDLDEAYAYGYTGMGDQDNYNPRNSPTIFDTNRSPAQTEDLPCCAQNGDACIPDAPCFGMCQCEPTEYVAQNLTDLPGRISGMRRGQPYSMPIYWRKPLGVMADMAFKTGGIMCPLLRLCEDYSNDCRPPHGGTPGVCYATDPDNPGSGILKLKDEYRREGRRQTCAIYKRSKGEQAADCVLRALGSSPYSVVAEEHE